MIDPAFQQLMQRSSVGQFWRALSDVRQEQAVLQQKLAELKTQISTLDRINVFTDSPDEAREKRFKERLAACKVEEQNSAQALQQFFQDCQNLRPEFANILQLEQATRLLLGGQIAQGGKALRQWLESLEQPFPVSGQESWAELLKNEFSRARPFLYAIWALLPVLQPVADWTLEGPRATLRYRSLVIHLLEKCRKALQEDCPGLPWPCELQALACPSPPTTHRLDRLLSAEDQQTLRAQLESLANQAIEAARLELLLSWNKKNISTMDRVVFWSDTRAEALEKQLKQQRKSVRTALKEDWVELCRVHCEARSQSWAGLWIDYFPGILPALKNIRVTSPTGMFTKTCQLLHREGAEREIDNLARQLRQRYSLDLSLANLRSAALSATPREGKPEPDARGNFPPLTAVELTGYLAAALQQARFQEKLDQAHQRQSRAREHEQEYRSIKGNQSGVERLVSLFRAGSEERSVRQQMHQAKTAADQDWEYLDLEYLEILWRLYPPAVALSEVSQLSDQIYRIEGVVRSYTTEDSEGNSSTRYESVISGLEPAISSYERLKKRLQEDLGDCPGAFEGLEQLAQGPLWQALAAGG